MRHLALTLSLGWCMRRGVSSNALHIIELMKSLPSEEQRLVCALLNRQFRQLTGTPQAKRSKFLRTPDGAYLNSNGIPNNDPFFTIMDAIEADRSDTVARPLPEFD